MTQVQELEIAKIDVHKLNPRRQVGDLTELTASIKEVGVLEPVLVVRDNGGYAIVAGTRRLAAAAQAGLKTIPAIERAMTEAEISAAALIENLQREDLSPLDEATGYRFWLTLTNKSQTDLAKAVGKAPSTIANALRLLEAPKPIQDALREKRITGAHARVAMTVPERALPLIDLKGDMSVAELQEQAKVAQRSYTNLERIRAAKEKAEAEGKVVTWREGELWIGGAEIDLSKVFGAPKKKLVGVLSQGGYGYYEPTTKVHAGVCECSAVAIVQDGKLVPACVSPTGWKKAQDKQRASERRASPEKRKKAKSAEDRRKELERDTKAAVKEADEALNFKKLHSYHPLKTNIAAPLLKGGLGGEPARLVLFGEVIQNSSGSNKSKTWEVELWKKIAKLPLKSVREYVTKWAVAAALEEIRGTNRYGMTPGGLGSNNATVITQLVSAHYGVRAKKAKR